jgi:uncharacterized repeat protein (TIGR03803 family)
MQRKNRARDLATWALFLGAATAALAGPAPAAAGTEKILYNFGGGEAGAQPFSGLTAVNGLFYGVTPEAGAYGQGALYALDPRADQATAVWNFGNGDDGDAPIARVIDIDGVLYGTTEQGGANCRHADEGCGTVYAFNLKTAKEKVLYSFCSQQNCTDGAYPDSALVDVKGLLYGVTPPCCSAQGGVVFSLDPKTGVEKVIYTFCSQQNCADGSQPIDLIAAKGVLYGVTEQGGASNLGAVFALDPQTKAETVLHAFTGGADGATPVTLIEADGALYGATYLGGGSTDSVCTRLAQGAGCGTIFALDPKTDAETVLYAFCGQQDCDDGAQPNGLTVTKDAIYGTTLAGGAGKLQEYFGGGTVFRLDRQTLTETVEYAFCVQQQCADGEGPSGLLDKDGKFYGTTSWGGDGGDGIAFEVRP